MVSGRGDAHPRVTGRDSKREAFYTVEEAKCYLKEWEVEAPREVIIAGAGETTPIRNSEAFYAVAHGKQLGVTPYW